MKKTLCFLLALILAVSAAAIAASAYSISDEGVMTVEYAVSLLDPPVETNRYWFIMPDGKSGFKDPETDEYCPSWYNQYTDGAGVFWWGGSAACAGWFGYKAMKGDAENVFYADVPKDVCQIIWNNGVDGGQIPTDPDDPEDKYYKTAQTKEIGCEYADPGEYDSLPKGAENFDNMVFVPYPPDSSHAEYSPKPVCPGTWYYYYGKGCYGSIENGGTDLAANCANPDHKHSAGENDPDGFDNDIIIKADKRLYKVQTGDIFTYEYVLYLDGNACSIDAVTTYDHTNLELITDKTNKKALFPIVGKNMTLNTKTDGKFKYNCSFTDGYEFKAENGDLPVLITFHVKVVTETPGVYEIKTDIKDLAGEDEHAYIKSDTVIDSDYSEFSVVKDEEGAPLPYEEVEDDPEDKDSDLLGDADGDGILSILDATAIQQHLANIKFILEKRLALSDVDKEDGVTILDATQIQRKLANLSSVFDKA